MKNLVFVFFLLINLNFFAQSQKSIQEIFQELKQKSKIDKSDKTVYNLLSNFYDKNLQADDDLLTDEDFRQLEAALSNPETKNYHILMLFAVYQRHISETAAVGKASDPAFQIEVMNILENETKSIYGKVPAIVYVYAAEAYDSGKRKEDFQKTVLRGLKDYPDSVPLKVYNYINTNDVNIKNDLIKNHSKHWMVKQFEIK